MNINIGYLSFAAMCNDVFNCKKLVLMKNLQEVSTNEESIKQT